VRREAVIAMPFRAASVVPWGASTVAIVAVCEAGRKQEDALKCCTNQASLINERLEN
jgi:hypothetical protein